MKYRIYTNQQKDEAVQLWKNGLNISEVSRKLDISRNTVKHWIHPRPKKTDKSRSNYIPITDFESYLDTEEKQKAYSFILAVYLCDGCISTYKRFRAPSIRFFNDTKYPKNTQEWVNNLKIVLPDNSVNYYKKKSSNCFIVLAYSRKLLDLFPQHGKGTKHTRKLELTDWQRKIIEKYPTEFVRGCIQSDGSIYLQTIAEKYIYKKYVFCNNSEDIIDFFLLALKFCGIEKRKYFHPKGQFIVQNFSKNDLIILESIISTKE